MAKNRNNSRGIRDDQELDDGERLGSPEPIIPLVDDDDGLEDERTGSQRGPMDPLIPIVESGATGDEPEFQDEHRDDHDRLMFDRDHEEREYTDEERLELFQLTLFQNHMPTIPNIPGYHICWLTTNNPRDPVHGRVRLGYELIKAAEIPGFEHSELKEGKYAGCIGVDEMVAAKLPLRLYAKYMTEAHHRQPLLEEQRLRANVDEIRQGLVSGQKNIPVVEESGTAALGRSPRRPRFEGLSG